MSFNQMILKNQYLKVKGLGDRLVLMKEQIDWKPFIPIIKSVYNDDKIIGGRPHTSELVIVRSLLLQAWYGLSDLELEFACNDRLSFRNFLDFSDNIPDFSTLWVAREKLSRSGKLDLIWNELQYQLDKKGYSIKKGVIQDATFIESDLGKKRSYKEKKAEEKGEKIEYSSKQLSHIDKDATFSIKNNQIHFGYKNHIKIDIDHELIRVFKTTTASLHDNQIDLSKKNEVMYRDRGYTGKETIAKGNATMKRGKLNTKNKLRNLRISKTRAHSERPFAVIKNVFSGVRTRVKNIFRVNCKELFKCFAYNLYQLVTLEKKKLA